MQISRISPRQSFGARLCQVILDKNPNNKALLRADKVIQEADCLQGDGIPMDAFVSFGVVNNPKWDYIQFVPLLNSRRFKVPVPLSLDFDVTSNNIKPTDDFPFVPPDVLIEHSFKGLSHEEVKRRCKIAKIPPEYW